MLSSNKARGGRWKWGSRWRQGRQASQHRQARQYRRARQGWGSAHCLVGALLAIGYLAACSDDYHTHNHYAQPPSGSGGAGGTGGDGSSGTQGQAGEPPDESLVGAPEVNTPLGKHQFELFGAAGHRYWFVVNDEQLEIMNEGMLGGGPVFDMFGDIYQPGGVSSTFVDHLFVSAGGKTADYGKIKLRLIGQSTARPWTRRTLPNLRLDANEYDKQLSFGGVEHIRFNNGLVGSIFREKITLELYRALGYPVPQATFAWVGSNVWGAGTLVPYTLVEVYKEPLCERWAEELGGGCLNMWEFFGDLGTGALGASDSCQFSECENTRALEFEQVVLSTPQGEGFKAALGDWLEWDEFHRFQCLSWILATGDDALHNQNNVLLVERADGLFQYLPYSIDISLGQEWYPEVPLTGWNTIANGCQSDVSCWADTIAACEQSIEDFAAVDPLSIANDVYDTLEREGMLREGDETRISQIRSWLEQRADFLADDLENWREPPKQCEYPLVLCNDGNCRFPEECEVVCGGFFRGLEQADAPEPPVDGAGGAPGEPCLPIEYYGVPDR